MCVIKLVEMITYKIKIICGVLLFTVNSSIAQLGLRTCLCVNNNQCYPNLPFNAIGQVDIRIVNNATSVITPPVTTLSPVPTSNPNSCTAGLIQCCNECGLVYNISFTPPAPYQSGQSKYGSQPWQAIILDNKNNYVGGGVLLDANNVLTTAHKVYAYRSIPDSIKVSLGVWDANINIEPYPRQNSNILKIFIHELYNDNAKNLFNDIAILRLATPILYGPTVNPAINTACMPNDKIIYDNRTCTVSGWGKDAFNGTYQIIVKQVDVSVVNNQICEDALRTKTRLGGYFLLDSKSFMCAGGESGKDACTGDGGSPLMCNIDGRYQVVGLVAWGIGCATANVPGVYVRVQSYLDWINTQIKSV